MSANGMTIKIELAKSLGISRQAVQKHLSNLKAAGRLRRIGPDKGGHWEVFG
jgi:predicted ArsR family transcriptional regulator